MILVTGASGFLGNYLLQELVKEDVPIRALYHTRKPAYDHHLVSWVCCDLLDVFAVEEVMQDVQEIYHCAAIVSFDKNDKQKVIERNVTATAHVVNEALLHPIKKMVHVSSIAALGRANVGGLPIDEDTHWQESSNNTAYAIGKFGAEMEVWRGMAEGLNAVVINPGIILGKGDWNEGSAKLMQNVANEFPYYTEGVNGWVDAEDVAKAMILLMKSDIAEERFILTEGNYSYRALFTKMANALGKKPPQKKASPWMTELIWRASELKAKLSGKKSLITRETARTAQSKCYYNNDKFLKEFPEFNYKSMDNTIEQMAKAFQKDCG